MRKMEYGSYKRISETFLLQRTYPVSYTHLDVYKRQLQPLINEILEDWNESTGYYFNKNPVPQAELEYAVSIGNYTAAFLPIQSDGDSPLDTLKKFRTNESGNVSGLSSKEYDSYIEKIENSSDYESLDTIIKAEKYLCDNAIFYPICTETRYYASAELSLIHI